MQRCDVSEIVRLTSCWPVKSRQQKLTRLSAASSPRTAAGQQRNASRHKCNEQWLCSQTHRQLVVVLAPSASKVVFLVGPLEPALSALAPRSVHAPTALGARARLREWPSASPGPTIINQQHSNNSNRPDTDSCGHTDRRTDRQMLHVKHHLSTVVVTLKLTNLRAADAGHSTSNIQ